VKLDFKFTIGCETTGVSSVNPFHLLQVFKELENSEATLLLICRRSEKSDFSIWNYVEKNGLENRVTLRQYYDRNDYGDLKQSCRIWIRKNTPLSKVTAEKLSDHISRFQGKRMEISDGKKHVMFFTGFHPYREEGQGVYMRLWLDSLKKTGHDVHLVHYQLDQGLTPAELRSRAAGDFRYYHEIAVTSGLVGKNENGLNIDLDDWCGKEALQGASDIARRYDFDSCFVFYPFHTAVFEVMPPETRKILVTPDSFSNRNRKMLEQGYSTAQWVSITRGGEQQACLRADTIVSIKEDEAVYFRDLVGDKREVVIAAPLSPLVDFQRSPFSGKLRIGYYASDTRVNRECILEFLSSRANSEFLLNNSSVVLAGTFCNGLSEYADDPLLQDEGIEIIGRLENLADLFGETDVIINPDKGGTGLKIKTLEPMYFAMPVISTLGGASGLNSGNRFHQAGEIRDLIPLLEEVIREPGILDELSRSSRDITENLNRESLAGINKVLRNSSVDLDPGIISADQDAQKVSEPGTGYTRPGSEKKLPLISIVLPFYNAEKNLETAVSSVTGHDYINIELILVDDASIDDSLMIAENLAQNDSRIRVLKHGRNMGAGPARNTGVLDARGDYLFFLDSDDILRRRALSLLVRTAAEEDVSLVIGSCNQVDEQGNYGEFDRDRDAGKEDCFGLIDGAEALRRSLNIEEGSFLPVRPWGMLFDLKMYWDSGLTFPPGAFEDLSVVPFLYKFAGKVVYLEDIVVTYTIREGSVTQSPLNLKKAHQYGDLWDVISRRITEFGVEDLRRDFKIFHVSHLLWLLNQGVFDKHVLEAVAELINGRMRLDTGVSYRDRNLRYMLEYVSRILKVSGAEKDFALWEKFVSGLGEDVVGGFFRHRMHQLGLLSRLK
jgi:glycosyltransferase involved in cell wall biosynthesis